MSFLVLNSGISGNSEVVKTSSEYSKKFVRKSKQEFVLFFCVGENARKKKIQCLWNQDRMIWDLKKRAGGPM
jgi:hypothetical protein